MNDARKAQVWIYARPANARGTLILLLQTCKERGAFWQPVTGKVEESETFECGALREATEETGIQFASSLIDLGYEFRFEGRWGPAHERAFCIEAPTRYALDPALLKLDPGEHVAARWVTLLDALPLLHFESNREGLRRLEQYMLGSTDRNR